MTAARIQRTASTQAGPCDLDRQLRGAGRSGKECLQGAIARHLATQPGYVRTRLHRALSPETGFAFVNVGEWASPPAFQAATSSEEFQRLATALRDFPAHPGLYQVEYDDEGAPSLNRS